MTQAKNTAITKWLKNIADSKIETEASCHDNDSNYWIGNPGKPINDEIRQEIEEARRAAFTKGFAKNSANFEDINFNASLEDWQLYAISALCCYLAGLWADHDLNIHNNPDIEMYFAANASALFSRNGFLDAEPEIYVTSIELIRLLLKEVESEETSERVIKKMLMMIEVENSKMKRKGGKLIPKDKSVVKNKLTDHIQFYIGTIESKIREPFENIKPEVSVLHIGPSAAKPFNTLITQGMSDQEMEVPVVYEYASKRIELMISLPAYWRLDADSLEQEEWAWPVDMLHKASLYPFVKNTHFEVGHTIDTGNPDDFAGFSCAIVTLSNETPEEFDKVEINGRNISFLCLYTLYEEELKLKLAEGAQQLRQLIHEKGENTTIIKPGRENYALEWFRDSFQSEESDGNNEIDFEKLSRLASQSSQPRAAEKSDEGEDPIKESNLIKEWCDSVVLNMLERAQNEIPISVMINLARTIDEQQELSAKELSIENSYKYALASTFALDANQAVYEWGKGKAVERIVKQLGDSSEEIELLCPGIIQLTLKLTPYVWVYEHKFSLDEAEDMRDRAWKKLCELSGPYSRKTKINIMEQAGRNYLGMRNLKSDLDACIIDWEEAAHRQGLLGWEEWEAGLFGGITYEALDSCQCPSDDENSQESLSKYLGSRLDNEIFYEDQYFAFIRISTEIFVERVNSQHGIDLDSASTYWAEAIMSSIEKIRAHKADQTLKDRRKSFGRRLTEFKWYLQYQWNLVTSKNRPDHAPGENMFSLRLYDIERDLGQNDFEQLISKAGGLQEFQQLLDWCNINQSRFTIRTINVLIDNGDVELGAKLLLHAKDAMNSGSLKMHIKYAEILLLAMDGFICFTNLSRIINSSQVLGSISLLFFYWVIWRPFWILVFMPDDNFFFSLDLVQIQKSCNWIIRFFRYFGIGLAALWFVEKLKITDFGSFDFWLCVVCGLSVTAYAESAAICAWTFWKNGCIGFFKELSRFKKAAGYKINKV